MTKVISVEKPTSPWEAALAERDDLTKFGDNAIALFALALKFGIDDLESTGTEAIVDGGNDKKVTRFILMKSKALQ